MVTRLLGFVVIVALHGLLFLHSGPDCVRLMLLTVVPLTAVDLVLHAVEVVHAACWKTVSASALRLGPFWLILRSNHQNALKGLMMYLQGPYWPIHAQNLLIHFVGCSRVLVLALLLLKVHLHSAAA